eukprot:TRINITY_DN72130_c0_g1_i1.p1 TRINITY_DN72130_c0_g1~~TRINITY_DN72130_c0_g1_i1.p1  ORF type:complete len:406 (+),score=71.47 TRINITY_DN72130_c0_g1_i1:49-1218(+)
MSEERVTSLFRAVDTSGQGYLSVRELYDIFQRLQIPTSDIPLLLEVHDVKQDGKVNIERLVSWLWHGTTTTNGAAGSACDGSRPRIGEACALPDLRRLSKQQAEDGSSDQGDGRDPPESDSAYSPRKSEPVTRRSSFFWESQRNRPKRLIFIRHGESEANVDREITRFVPDHMLHLTEKGRNQALDAGRRLRELVGEESIKFIVSPYVRTRETFNGIKHAWGDKKLPMRVDVRIREQEFGNLDSPDMKKLHQLKKKFGAFYFRFPDGESPADCYERASSFFESMYRTWEDNTVENHVIVGHGMMILMLIMRFMRLSVEDWEELDSLRNCEFVVMERPADSYKYDIAFTWCGGEEKNMSGLRKKQPLPKNEIWDGHPDTPLLISNAANFA